MKAILSSGLIKGIGPKTAEKIYDKFGDQTLDILDNHTEKLIRENPYRLRDMAGIGFVTADKIAVDTGLSPTSAFRIDAGIRHTLKEAESCGHLCLEKTHFVKECVKLLNTDGVDYRTVGERAFTMLKNGDIAVYGSYVYRLSAARAEQSIAGNVNSLLSYGAVMHKKDLDAEINLEEREIGIKLAFEQRQAVKTALTSRLCIITGGPGTGKTLIQRVLLGIYKKLNPDAKIICCAPTGRAARRMEQCTGFPSATIHKTLGLMSGDDEEWGEPETLDADFVLVDELSMVDAYLAKYLFDSVSSRAQLVLVGDSDQLPSVGPGAVLSELTACGRIPVIRLDKVFRQNEGSRIAVNAKLIRHNNLSLEYGDDFRFIESNDYNESADIIERLFQSEVDSLGLDNVALLTPFRNKTETGVNALNGRLRDIINPAAPNKPEAARGRRLFRLGDKVMQTKNSGDVSNGDIGYITDI